MNLLEKILATFAPAASDAPRAPDHAPEPPPLDPAILAQLDGVRRAAWLPVLSPGEGAVGTSKFGGGAALAPGEPWPTCPSCRAPLQLFLQLNSAELPVESPFGPGLLQFFYCTSGDCEVAQEGWEPFTPVSLLRVRDRGPLRAVACPREDAFPAHAITGWTRADDYPNEEERMDLGAVLRDASGQTDDAAEDAFLERYPLPGPKLLGWPAWVQGVEYPDCPRCGARMTLVFQIDSDDPLPYMWGDCGTGHITRCPAHPEVLAFSWACC